MKGKKDAQSQNLQYRELFRRSDGILYQTRHRNRYSTGHDTLTAYRIPGYVTRGDHIPKNTE